MTLLRPISLLIIIAALPVLAAAPVRAGEPNCSSCHETLAAGKSVHAAVFMGCASCHTAVDASDVPHKITNRNAKGLSAKMRDLCFGCHDRKPFMKNTVHGALLLGCTSCHDPHASDHAHLLKEDIPGLCLSCHGERLAEQQGRTHVLTGNEACATCHNPHATDTPKLVEPGRGTSPGDQTTLAGKPASEKQQ
jgi:predicted CXXCH cytochrome family protein